MGPKSIISVTQQHVKASRMDKGECFPGTFLQMERACEGPRAVTGLHIGPQSRTHQAVAEYGEEGGGWPVMSYIFFLTEMVFS